MRALGLGLLASLAACGQVAGGGPDAGSPYWSIAGTAPEGMNPVSVQYVDASAIDGRTVRQATTIAFISLPENPTRFGLRMEIVNDYDCRARRVRPISTSLATRGQPPVVNRENREWVGVADHPNVLPLFDFVCGDEDAREADTRFEHITDRRPLENIADASFAANPAGRARQQR